MISALLLVTCANFSGTYVSRLDNGWTIKLDLRQSECDKLDAVYDYEGTRVARKIPLDGVKRPILDNADVRSLESFRWLSGDTILSEVEVYWKENGRITFAENRMSQDAQGNWIEAETYFDADHRPTGENLTIYFKAAP